MSNHTPGRLTTDEAEHDTPYQNIEIKAGAHHTVATVWIDDAPVEDFNAAQRANSRRLVACWNACEGVDTQTLEQHPAPFSALRAERDELLEAAKLVIAWYEAEDDHTKADFYQRMEMCRTAEHALRAAIAKATGSQT